MDLLNELIEHGIKTIPAIMAEYEKPLDTVERNLNIKGKNLEKANVEHASWLSYYDQRRIELHTMCKYIDLQIGKVKGQLFKQYTEHYSRELTDRAKAQYIEHEPEYLKWNEAFLYVKELYDKYESVVESFKARGYALNNIVKLRVGSLEDTVV